jgi:hypothetical protein
MWLSGSGFVKAIVIRPEVLPTFRDAASNPGDFPASNIAFRRYSYWINGLIDDEGISAFPRALTPGPALDINLQLPAFWVNDDNICLPRTADVLEDLAAFPVR